VEGGFEREKAGVDCEEEEADEDPNEKPDMVFLSPSLARFWWVCASDWGALKESKFYTVVGL
jgi:hypothetical protein